MGIYIGTQKIDHIYKGTTELSKIRIGEEMTSLIEGDDFVRAKWLVGDGTAYIDTNILLNDTSILWDFNVRRTVTDNSNNVFFWIRNGTGSDSSYPSSMFLLNMEGYTRIANFSSGRASIYGTIIPVDLSISEYGVGCTDAKFIINGTEYTRTVIPEIPYSNKSLKLFKVDIDVSVTATTQCDCEYFNVTKNGVSMLQLTPVRLLAPIPPSFDANGIARNADECGMYNSVNGLFYGNVNTSGNFSVSNE